MREANKDLPMIDVLMKVENVRKMVEDIDEVLGNHLGAYGAPLLYLVREHVDPNEVEDPGFGVPDAMSELVRHTRHDGDHKDGRAAYFALKHHYMGRSFQKCNIAQADRVLQTVFYDGKARNYSFEDYCQKLNLAFLDLEEAGELVTEDRKVDKKKQAAAKARGSTRNISSVTRTSGSSNNKKGGGKAGKGKGGKAKKGKDGVLYYKWKEWIKLPKEKQEEVRNAREKAKSETRNASAVETADSDSDDVVETTGDCMSQRPSLSVQRIAAALQQQASGRAELDLHCDTCSFGKDAVLVYDTGKTVLVEPFISSLGKVTKVPIGTVAVAYDYPMTLQTYILFFHQSLYFSNMHRHLISPAQLCHNQVVVTETPLLHLPPEQHRPESLSILFSDPSFQIPLKLKGTISYFPTRRPTNKELNSDADCIHVNVTSESFWDPMDSNHAHDEDSLRVSLDSEIRLGGQRMLGSVTSERTFVPPARSIAVISAERGSAAFDIDSYTASLTSATISTKNWKAFVTPKDLAKRWSIGIETARRTLQHTTQRAIWDFSTVSGTRRLKPFAYQLRYPRLITEMYCDILVGTCVSLLGNKYAAVYCTPFHWICVDPIKKKSDAHYMLDNLFCRVRVPHTLIPDNAGDVTAGEFKQKAQRAQATIRPFEAHTFPTLISLKTAFLDGEVPQTLLTGDTADISHICEFGWYDWVWYISPQEHLGRYLGPSFDVGNVLCARILPASGRPISREVEAYHANQIAEAIYAEVDDHGRASYVLKEIVDYKKESYTVPPEEAFVIVNNQKYPKRTTKGWKLCCLWNDGTTTWEKLKDLKHSHPLQLAEFAVARQIAEEPAFSWWVPYTLKKRTRIIKAMAKRYFCVTQKYGIALPKTVEEALAIDRATGTDFWAKAIAKEMRAVAKAFQILDEDAPNPAGFTKIAVHMVFDIKPDFTQKARLVAGGHMTDPPSSITYASVVSRERVRIAFLLAALKTWILWQQILEMRT
ncbi:hypothetical protein FisN_14Lu214 [Fistulifera solaris]|uniref:Integrase catalytic domain-containing protein n=1 Tax=Fistulifera solaris TaxID=1519565 RepID=A0A1Z5J9Q9_FISSO|nr:hypothetical protein FisN_14Lu214 [Fistulifera solaris]|eukprot:GAX10696.1 hypothetical protein FisN_14Lu214 [Fistulifera solaris]